MSIIEKAVGKLDQIEKEEKARMPKALASIEFDQESEIEQSEVADEIDKTHLHDAPSQSNLAIIDLTRLHGLGMVTPDEEKTQIVEEFRIIKRPLITNAFNQGAKRINNGNLIMVTSAIAGEGKSFCAINLAMSIAMEMDHTVLLIDADVASPSIPKYLGVKNERGLLDVILDDKLELADVMMKTNVEKLSILTSGRKSRHSTELLASQSMSDLLTEIAQRYRERIIIFDSPHLLLTSESRVLASQMGQIVLVVEAETTPQKVVMEALRQLESCEAINLIYNKARPFPGGDLYGYDYN